MILTRKLIAPAAILFTVFLAVLFAYFFNSLHQVYHEAEERDLATFSNAFSVEIENQKNLALSLAVTAADNPAIQQAFAERERERLSELALPGYSMLVDAGANISQSRYYLADGSLFFSASPEAGASAIASPAVLLVLSEQQALAGLEIQGGALAIRGISPAFYENRFIGAVEYEIKLNAAALEAMQKKYGADWRILILKDLTSSDAALEPGPVENLLVVTRTKNAIISNDADSYRRALLGESVITHPSQDGRDYALQTSPIYDYSGKTIGALDIVYDHTHISVAQNRRLIFAGLASAAALILGLIGLFLLMSRTLQPIQTLTNAASAISTGKALPHINLKPENDEIGILVSAFNRMTAQLNASISNLEERVSERTRELEEQSLRLRVAAEISQNSVAMRRLDMVLESSARLILDRFNYYHVGIFLVDKENKLAALAASPTEAGRQMLDAGFQIQIGEPTPLGRAAASGEPRVLSGNASEVSVVKNELLPASRSELVLPLKVEDRVIGILDIHSVHDQAFKPEEVSVMLVLADQLASAIERTRLLEESTFTLNELERAYGQFTRTGWQRYAASGRARNVGYRFNNIRIEPVASPPPAGKEALTTGAPVIPVGNDAGREAALPLKFRGQTIGVVHAKLREGQSDSALATLQQAVDRLASALESARLYEEARIRADREQAISQITSAISLSSDYESILRTTIREIGHALPDTEVGIQIIDDSNQASLAEGRD